jgi:hypothetical protein
MTKRILDQPEQINQVEPKRLKIKMRSKDKENPKDEATTRQPPYHIYLMKPSPKTPSSPYKPQSNSFIRSNPPLSPSGRQSRPRNCRTCHEISNPTLAVSETFAHITSVTDHGFRGLFILLSIRPQLVLSRPSPYLAYVRATFGSICEGCEVDELRLSEPGDDGAEDPDVSADAAVEFAVALAAAAATAGLQCAQTKMLKPRPLQLRQIAPLGIGLVLGDIKAILWCIPRGIPCATSACNYRPPSDA